MSDLPTKTQLMEIARRAMSSHCASVSRLGAIVRHTGEYCRSVGYYTPPLNGIVVAAREDDDYITVWWCDQDAGEGYATRVGSIELHPENAHISDSMRQCLIDEFDAAQGGI